MNRARWMLTTATVCVLGCLTYEARAQSTVVSEYWRITEGDTGYDSPSDLTIDAFGVSFVTGTRTTGTGESEFFTTRYSALRDNTTLEPDDRWEAT